MRIHTYIVLVGFVSLLAAQSVSGQGLTLSGVVSNSRSRVHIEGASVSVVGNLAKHDAVTDVDGIFVVAFADTVKRGDVVRIRIQKTGYASYDKQVSVVPELVLQISLVPSDPPQKKPPGQNVEQNQSDVFQNLSGTVALPSSGDPFLSVFTVANGGKSAIIERQIWCGINMLIVADGVQIGPAMARIVKSGTTVIEPGGDAQSEACLASAFRGSVGCADITLSLDYSLQMQPAIALSKAFRFVTRRESEGLHWYKKPVETKESYCFDKVFQAPYGNIAPEGIVSQTTTHDSRSFEREPGQSGKGMNEANPPKGRSERFVPSEQAAPLISPTDLDLTIRVTALGELLPLKGVEILIINADGTHLPRTVTDERGQARVRDKVLRPITIFCSAEKFHHYYKQAIEPSAVTAIMMEPNPNGGSMIIVQDTGYIPGLDGRLNPISASGGRGYLYADNIAIDGGKVQPVSFEFGHPINARDSHGNVLQLEFAAIVGRSSLVDYTRMPN